MSTGAVVYPGWCRTGGYTGCSTPPGIARAQPMVYLLVYGSHMAVYGSHMAVYGSHMVLYPWVWEGVPTIDLLGRKCQNSVMRLNSVPNSAKQCQNSEN